MLIIVLMRPDTYMLFKRVSLPAFLSKQVYTTAI